MKEKLGSVPKSEKERLAKEYNENLRMEIKKIEEQEEMFNCFDAKTELLEKQWEKEDERASFSGPDFMDEETIIMDSFKNGTQELHGL